MMTIAHPVVVTASSFVAMVALGLSTSVAWIRR